MKFIICPDSFKESINASKASSAIKEGLLKIFPDAYFDMIPLSDGGEGFIDVMINSLNGKLEYANVLNPLGEEITAKYGYIINEKKAIIEVAEACGLCLVPEHMRNPSITTTYGVGQLIIDALNKGATKMLIGLGGSSTNDGGIGMLMALGAKVFDKNGIEINDFHNILSKVKDVDITNLDKRLRDISIEIACDVKNPLLGEKGATHTFAPQKGADRAMVLALENLMENYSEIIKKAFRNDFSKTPGTGAAGGLGFAFCALGFEMKNGIDLVLHHTYFEERIKDADFIITGEGSIDEGSLNGKVISGVAKISKKHDKPVIALCGKISDNLKNIYEMGITSIFCITDSPKTLDEALRDGEKSIIKTSENIGRLINRAYCLK